MYGFYPKKKCMGSEVGFRGVGLYEIFKKIIIYMHNWYGLVWTRFLRCKTEIKIRLNQSCLNIFLLLLIFLVNPILTSFSNNIRLCFSISMPTSKLYALVACLHFLSIFSSCKSHGERDRRI